MKHILPLAGIIVLAGCSSQNTTDQELTKDFDELHRDMVVSVRSVDQQGGSQYITSPPIPAQVTFAGQKIPLHREDVKEALEYELTVNMFRHSRTITIIRNMERWRPLILKTLEANGIPQDFIYLAVAESEFDNTAQSYAGAMGMWQFMEATAKDYGLVIDKDVDMRRDPKLATEAASRYLKWAHAQLKDWALVAAAYNRGVQGIQNVMRDQQTNSFFDMHLNPETERYLYRIIAFKLILENPQAYGYYLDPKDSYKPYAFSTETLNENQVIDLIAFAKKYKTTYKELRKLNPWFNNTSTYKLSVPKNNTYEVRVPMPTGAPSLN